MNTRDFISLTSGAILLGYVIVGVFFWRFWSRTRDRLFVCFAIAFWILAFERLLMVGVGSVLSHHPGLYLTRLIAFLVIIWAIWDKNHPTRSG